MNFDESERMSSEQAWELLEDWEWDALTGRFQDYLILLSRERQTFREALENILGIAATSESVTMDADIGQVYRVTRSALGAID